MKRPSGLTLLTCALLVLLPALAVLQYQWVGQVSTAEQERMQRNLRVAAFQFRETFDGEVGRAVITLQVGAATARDGASDRYSDRYDAWLNTAVHPSIVANIYLVDAPGPDLRLRRWEPNSHTFMERAWPAVLERWRLQFEQERLAFDANRDRRGGPGNPSIDDDALVVFPLRNLEMRRDGPRDDQRDPQRDQPRDPQRDQQRDATRDGQRGRDDRDQDGRPDPPPFGFTVIELNLDYIRSQMLPQLAQRNFTHSDGDSYRVSVTAANDPQRVIYRSDSGTPIDLAHADAIESLYGPDPLFFLMRGRGPGGQEPTRNIILIEGQNPQQTTVRTQMADAGRWRLAVQHQSGSLEAAVGRVRRRNLAISGSVMLLLSLSVALLAMSSRRAQRLATQQMEFVAGISHELRTPVAVIKSAAENLSHGVVGSVDRVKRYGVMIDSEARRLGDMVERVLQYAAIESGLGVGMRTPLAPEDIIQSALDASVHILAPEDVQVHRDIALNLPPVVGDAAALRSAVQNLIANAVKYGGRDRWIGIRAEHFPGRRHGEVRITVSDHGDGIDPAELPHIFEPFYRGADAIAQQIHGNGLGLSLVRRIVEAHGGRVAATSRPGAGSAFTIALPAASADERANVVSNDVRIEAQT